MSVSVVTDSSAVMPDQWLRDLPLHVVPLQLAWADGRTSEDGTFTPDLMGAPPHKRPPTTSAPAPGAYQALFEELLAGGGSVLAVCPPSELSTTYSNATLAARQLPGDRIRVLDASTAAAGQGIVAAEGARFAAQGGSLDAAVDRALEVAGRLQMWATLTQLESLRRSGRVPAVAAVGAGALRLQPIVRYAGGSPTPVGVTRSAIKGAQRLYRAWERSIPSDEGKDLRAVAFHAARGEEAADISRRISERVAAEVHTVEVNASLAAHTGPGLLGLAWFWDN